MTTLRSVKSIFHSTRRGSRRHRRRRRRKSGTVAAPLYTVYSTSTSLKEGARGRPGPICVRILIGGLPTFKKKKRRMSRLVRPRLAHAKRPPLLGYNHLFGFRHQQTARHRRTRPTRAHPRPLLLHHKQRDTRHARRARYKEANKAEGPSRLLFLV